MNENKDELFHYLSQEIANHRFATGKQILVTFDKKVLTIDSAPMPLCSHEEADTRIFIHVLDALDEGNNTIQIRTVDTDVVIIAIGKFHDIFARYPDFDLWIKFGTGVSQKMLHINSLCDRIEKPVARGLPFFHAFTGSDTTSFFKTKGKKTAWNTWKGFRAITAVFEALSQNPFSTLSMESPEFEQLQKFTIWMYSRGIEVSKVNEARHVLFGLNQNLEKIPPTEDALFQHVLRAVYQTGTDS